jgi:hypothetical protein
VSLVDFQSAVGRLVRAATGPDPLRGLRLDPDERARLAALRESAGFRFTVDVQRSWCAGRAARAAKLTLSLLPAAERRRVLDDWVNAGGGTASFVATEADAFLDFIAGRLRDPSHTLTLCRFEQAALRASEGALGFVRPDPSLLEGTGRLLRAGRHAALVRFHAAPHLVLAALDGAPLPPLSGEATAVVFGPGLPGLSRMATPEESALWERLAVPTARAELSGEGYRVETIEALVAAGVVEPASTVYEPSPDEFEPDRQTRRSG